MQKVDFGILILRIAFGVSMMCHGWNKLFSPSGLKGTAGWFSAIGMKWPKLQARVACGTELLAGALLAIGLLTGPSATTFIALMIVAIITVHARVGYFIFLPNGGWEYCASIIAVSTAISVMGPGKYSLDHAWGLTSDLSVWALPVGVLAALCHVAISYRPASARPES